MGVDTPVLLVSPQVTADTAVPIGVSTGGRSHSCTNLCLRRCLLIHLYLLVSPQVASNTHALIGVSRALIQRRL